MWLPRFLDFVPGQNPETKVIVTVNVISLNVRQLLSCEAVSYVDAIVRCIKVRGNNDPNQKTIILLTSGKVASADPSGRAV